MKEFLIINAEEKRWRELIRRSLEYDFYHSSCYHLMENEGKPQLFTAIWNNDFIAFPLVVRSIEGTDYYDCTSVYGYGGPISNREFGRIPKELLSFFRDKLLTYFKDNGIITAFSRLHPIIMSDSLFEDFGIVENVNKTVAIDLRLSLEEQRQQYRKSNKSEINQLRKRKGYVVKEAETTQEILRFISIYYSTMDRVHAADRYYFDKAYFFQLLNNSCFSSKLLVAWRDTQMAAGAIVTITGQIMQYHLSGTDEIFERDTPMKLILDEARIMGSQMGLSYFHLGGGVGGHDDDSLFRFKAGFSKQRFMYRTWKFVVDEQKYRNLCISKIGSQSVESTYFPLYRAPL